MRFSERHGYKPVKSVIQIDSMDEALRNGLWSVLVEQCWEPIRKASDALYPSQTPYLAQPGDAFLNKLWRDFFEKPVDAREPQWRTTYKELRGWFFGCQWFEVYDLVEFVAQTFFSGAAMLGYFRKNCNVILERELSGYLLVGTSITPITDPQEIAAIEEALAQEKKSPVGTHLNRALELLSDRKKPDYRNSIKESISAVEAACKRASGKDKGDLSDALKLMPLHPALRSGFEKLYGWTSNAEGMRHALMDEEGLKPEDAKFMLVACSAFVNYLEAKRARK